jgi:DNA replication protein DnaC
MQRLEKEWEEPYRWREITAYEMRWFTAFDICLDRANMYEARNTPMLIIDDLGCESDTITNRAIINDVIAYRYSYSVPTIITSNLDPDEMQTRYKARLYERIIQTGKVVDAGRYNKRIEVQERGM